MTRLIIVRHGDTFDPGEAPRRIGSRTDLPLTESGRRQASRLRHYIKQTGISFSTVLSGRLQRTIQTARLILGKDGDDHQVNIADFLTEIDHGPDENQRDVDVVRRIGEAAMNAWDCDAIAPAEWLTDTPHRIAAWRAVLSAPPMGDTLLVTSNGAAKFLFLADPTLRPQESLKLRTGSLGIVDRKQGGWNTTIWDYRP